MSRFTFAAGNAWKIASLPLYGVGALLARIVPRDDALWVVGSGTGLAEGPLAVARAVAQVPGRQVIWLAGSSDELAAARAMGLGAIARRSLLGFWSTLRARVVVVTHGFGDVNRFGTHGALTVDLHHGTPIKLLHLDSPATVRLPALNGFRPLVRLLRSMYVRAAAGIDVFVAASSTAAERFTTAYALRPEQIALTGDPRLDGVMRQLIASGGAPVVPEALLAELELVARPSGGLVLYAPTWRDGQADPLGPTADEWEALVERLEALDAVLVIRSHPLGFSADRASAPATGRVRFLPAECWTDITSVLAAFDVVVTDYSAIGIDFSVTERPLVFFAPDVAAYASSRGLYEPYATYTEDGYVDDWAGVISELGRLGDDPAFREERRARTRRLAARFVMFRDADSTRRLLEIVDARLRARRVV